MNNYHLFLIRSSPVTQLAAHLAAGIVALALISSVWTSKPAIRSEAVPSLPTVGVELPHGTTVLADSGADLR